MRNYVLVMAFLACLHLYADDALMISPDGETVVLKSYRISNGMIYFKMADGSEDKVAKKNVFAILERAKRATSYSPEDTRKQIAEARRVFNEFPRLKKQLQPLLDEWLRIRSQHKELSPKKMAKMREEINKYFAAYKASAKNEAAYLELRQNLEMIRYRDFRGAFEKEINTTLQRLGNDLIETMAAELEPKIEQPELRFEQYQDIKRTIRRMMTYYPPDDMKKALREFDVDAQKTCLKTELKAAVKTFKKDRGITGYLNANALLLRLENRLGDMPDTRPGVNKLRSKMQSTLKTTYDFQSKALPGYPLTKADKQILSKAFKYCSSPTGPVENPKAILFPIQPGDRLRLSHNRPIVLKAIFNAMPTNANLELVVEPLNAKVRPKGKLNKNAMEITLTPDLIKRMLKTDEKGDELTTIHLYLASKDGEKLSNPIRFKIKR